ncbi:EamA family transporter [Proteocatella sphenisci]|uniref:EamA family transporter n=1 Tax=Proteocatella sphenisci TaxID=181070 RepID=UPI0004B2CA15|nr:EamA family transporter [Proteocatella sphenisci]
MNTQTKGALLILGAAFFWGISGTVAKMIFNTDIDPIAVSNMRISLAAVICIIYLAMGHSNLLQVSSTGLKKIGILGISMTLMQGTYYYAIARLNVSLAIFIQYLSPIIITAYCSIVLKEKMKLSKGIALVFAMAGSYFIIFGGAGLGIKLNIDGVVAGLISAFCSAFYIIYGQKCTGNYDPWTVLTFGMATGALIYMFICPPWILWAGRSSSELLFIGYLAIFGTIVPFTLYLKGFRYLAPSAVNIIGMSETVVASLSAYLILGEVLSTKQILGAVLIVMAVITIQSLDYILDYIKKGL